MSRADTWLLDRILYSSQEICWCSKYCMRNIVFGPRYFRNKFSNKRLYIQEFHERAGEEAAAFEVLAESAPRLVRQIMEQNLPHFARLFTAVVLQAAAAGEALLDQELTDLAQRNPARFSRLNQRMQVTGHPLHKSKRYAPSGLLSMRHKAMQRHAASKGYVIYAGALYRKRYALPAVNAR